MACEQLEAALREARQHTWGLYLHDKDKFLRLLDVIDDALEVSVKENRRKDDTGRVVT